MFNRNVKYKKKGKNLIRLKKHLGSKDCHLNFAKSAGKSVFSYTVNLQNAAVIFTELPKGLP